MATTETTQPEYTNPSDITTWSDDHIDKMLDGIRYRRMQYHQLYKQTMALKEKAKSQKIEAQFEKKMEQFSKELTKFDKYVERVEKYANDVRALRLQMGETIL